MGFQCGIECDTNGKTGGAMECETELVSVGMTE